MITEDYCYYEVAKLLEKKGFPMIEHLFMYVNKNNMFMTHDYASLNLPLEEYKIFDEMYIPTITHQMAMKWLRKKHKIDISVTPDDGSWWIKVTELEYWSYVFNGKVLNGDDIKYAYKGDTSTKEGCYEAGLWYVLKNLI